MVERRPRGPAARAGRSAPVCLALFLVAAGAATTGLAWAAPAEQGAAPTAMAGAGRYGPAWQATDCATFKLEVPDGTAVDCGYVTAPLRHAAPAGPTIRLATVVLRATGADRRPDPLFLAQGGPGGSTIESFGQILVDDPGSRPTTNRDLVLWDQRGTLYSKPALLCPEATRAGLAAARADAPPDAEAAEDRAMQACGRRLAGEAGDLSAFNTVENASDAELLRRVLGYDRFNFYGVSYGTELGQYLIRQHPERLRSVILDAVVPTSFNLVTEVGPVKQRIADKYFQSCAGEAACAAAFPNLGQRFVALLVRLDSTPAVVEITDPEDGRKRYRIKITGGALEDALYTSLYLRPMHDLIPYVVHRAEQGDFSFLANTVMTLSLFDQTQAQGMYMTVVCAERGDSDPAAVENSQLHPRIVREERKSAEDLLAVCREWDIRLLPREVLQPVVSDVPALLLSGDFDPITPPAMAAQVAQGLSRSTQVVFPSGTHGQAFTTACANGIIQRFLDNPEGSPEATCAARPSGSFLTPEDVTIVPPARQFFALGPARAGEAILAILREAAPLLAGLPLLASAVLVYPIGQAAAVARGRRGGAESAAAGTGAGRPPRGTGRQRVTGVLAALGSWLAVATFLAVVGVLFAFASALALTGVQNELLLLMGAIPSGVAGVVFRLPPLVAALAALMVVAGVAMWLGRHGSLPWRIYYAVLVLAALGCVGGLVGLGLIGPGAPA